MGAIHDFCAEKMKKKQHTHTHAHDSAMRTMCSGPPKWPVECVPQRQLCSCLVAGQVKTLVSSYLLLGSDLLSKPEQFGKKLGSERICPYIYSPSWL